MDRRLFIKRTGQFGLATSLSHLVLPVILGDDMDWLTPDTKPFFKLSLAQWSLHNAFNSKVLPTMEFAKVAKEFGFEGLEYVSSFYLPEKGKESELVRTVSELKKRSDDHGLENVLIMVDEGDLSTADNAVRQATIDAHHKWIDAAAGLGCHSIRVNLFGGETEKTPQVWMEKSAESLRKLCETAAKSKINVIVENHQLLSSDAAKVAKIIQNVNMKNCGTLPDFGNFCLKREGSERFSGKCIEEYDRYKGMQELLPFAKGVSAKSYDFNMAGEETTIDYKKMLQLVKASGYRGFIGVEYEGTRLSEVDGLMATKALLLKHANV
ncbi:sugar phosphate isomerase/epimerase family protein [Flavobacterium selenitireducens]|uniref:sugar phosphate isomerase/epimerase family protein n=1 Tax=Flavobacterium selenitireducens TaxID=2722704 RepID=UPI00168AD403|nr:sugar phosphate isomerase/epimerase family protein [Flavobacterium selenitireducens]MBD3581325.1 sugar phosphate isomerase/epimerase [Flavobacterium selenitireducens]